MYTIAAERRYGNEDSYGIHRHSSFCESDRQRRDPFRGVTDDRRKNDFRTFRGGGRGGIGLRILRMPSAVWIHDRHDGKNRLFPARFRCGVRKGFWAL